MRILVNALSGIGDALMFTPALRLLRNSLPEANIEAMVMYKGVKDFYERIPQIDKVHYYDFLNSNPLSALKFVLSLRGKFDASINVYPSNRKEYNIINRIIGADKRVGVRYLRKDNVNWGFLNNFTIMENDSLHNVEENVKLIELITGESYDDIPGLLFPLYEEDRAFAKRFLRGLNLNGKKLIGFHAGCSTLKNHIKRRWSPEKFADLAIRLISLFDTDILLFGGPEELKLNQRISDLALSNRVHVVETGSLIQTAAIIEKTELFVTNDSGLMHIASALGKKIVPIIGPTSLNYIHPWKTEYVAASLNLDCSPCFIYSPSPLSCKRDDVKFKCLRELSVDLVVEKIKELLKSNGNTVS